MIIIWPINLQYFELLFNSHVIKNSWEFGTYNT